MTTFCILCLFSLKISNSMPYGVCFRCKDLIRRRAIPHWLP